MGHHLRYCMAKIMRYNPFRPLARHYEAGILLLLLSLAVLLVISLAPLRIAGCKVDLLVFLGVYPDYRRTEVMIPMRDGVKLHTVILSPAHIVKPLPFMIDRTPYGTDHMDRLTLFASRPNLAHEGYVFVLQDVRGCYASQGKFVMMRPMTDHRDPKATDESTDAWDTVAWLIRNVAGNNDRAGFIGTSYDGFLAIAAGVDPHPAVRAISPQAPMIDTWLGDDFFHNGAFRQSFGYDYVLGMESGNGKKFEAYYGAADAGQPRDGYQYFLERSDFQEEVKRSGLPLLPTWKLFLEHPAYDEVWRFRSLESTLNKVVVPTLTVGGYYDEEDMYGPQEEYSLLEDHDTDHHNFLVLGPWTHGQWTQRTPLTDKIKSRLTRETNWGSTTGDEYRGQIEAKFSRDILALGRVSRHNRRV